MEDETDEFFMSESSNYLESIIKSRALLHKHGAHGETRPLVDKMNELIDLELDLAIAAAKKATAKDNIRPIK